ncbi:MAG: glycosyltransferase [Eubacteriales bacterium]
MKILIDSQVFQSDDINRGIGKSFINILNNILKFDLINEWYIGTPEKNLLRDLDTFAYHRINIIEDSRFGCKGADGSSESSNAEYTETLKECITKLKINLYWNPNPMMLNVLFPNDELGIDMVFTFYDMIPYIFKNQYFKTWTKKQQEEYKRRAEYVSRGRVMFISESSRRDFLEYVNSSVENTKVIYLGVDAKEFAQPFWGNNSNYDVLYVGGEDFRKNMSGAIDAFAEAKEKYAGTDFDNAVLNIVCSLSDESKISIADKINSKSISDSVVLHGYVSDERLYELYRKCSVFFFPSIYEGFGMPVLEALASGCRVICGENSSLMEVGRDYVTYCDAENISDMADKLYESVIDSKGENIEKARERIKYAKSLSWETTAIKMLEYITENVDLECEKKKVAFVTPWPSQKTGIAEYIYSIVDEIKEYYRITVFVDDTTEKGEYAEIDAVEVVSIKKFADRKDEFDEWIYQLGNNTSYHTQIYKLAEKYPGIVEIHDINMNGFFHNLVFSGRGKKQDIELYKRALEHFGEQGKKIYENVDANTIGIDVEEYNLLDRVCSLSKKVIVHNRWAKSKMHDTDNVEIIPLAARIEDREYPENFVSIFKEKHGIAEMDYIVTCAGFVNENKRYDKVIEAVYELNIAGYPTSLVFAGSAGINEEKVQRYISKYKLADKVKITGFTDKNEYLLALNACDILVNLRYPTMGESSYTLCEAFACKKPVLVSNVGQYKEFPDDAAWKVDVDENEVKQLVGYISYLFKNPGVRKALGENGYNFAKYALNIQKIGKLYKKIIDSQ